MVKAIDTQLIFAEEEDVWDESLRKDYGVVDKDNRGKIVSGRQDSWTSSLREARKELIGKIHERDAQHTAMGNKMWDIVVKERELAKKEKLEARQARTQTKPLLGNEGDGGISGTTDTSSP